jgi:glycerol-3-phosphate responsive antiterminator
VPTSRPRLPPGAYDLLLQRLLALDSTEGWAALAYVADAWPLEILPGTIKKVVMIVMTSTNIHCYVT